MDRIRSAMRRATLAARPGGVEALVKRLQISEDPALLREGADALVIACSSIGQTAVSGFGQRAADAGAVEALMQLISSSNQKEPGVPSQAAAALGTICCCSSEGVRQRAAGAGALEVLVQPISSSNGGNVRSEALTALGNICGGDSADIKQRAADAGAVEALVRLSSSSKDPGLLLGAVGALANISYGASANI
jgi:hypothetical protein